MEHPAACLRRTKACLPLGRDVCGELSILMLASPVFLWDALFHSWTSLDAALKTIRVRGESIWRAT